MDLIDPKYIHLVQKPECCAVACLQMILYRRGFGLYDQEQLAQFFGVKVSEEYKDMFNVDLQIMTSYNNDEGISSVASSEKINEFFAKNKINLCAKGFFFHEINNLKQFIEENVKKNKDLWIEYKAHEIHKGCRFNDGKYIHDGLIESIKSENFIIIDPFCFHKPRITVSIEQLKRGIDNTFGKETGFIIINKRKD
jgi:hypothetical protein